MMKPTLRDNFRYLLVDCCIEDKDVKVAVERELEKFLGVLGMYNTGVRVISVEGKKAVVRVIRGHEDLVCAAFALCNKRDGKTLRMRVQRISGTILALCKKEGIRRTKRVKRSSRANRGK